MIKMKGETNYNPVKKINLFIKNVKWNKRKKKRTQGTNKYCKMEYSAIQ